MVLPLLITILMCAIALVTPFRSPDKQHQVFLKPASFWRALNPINWETTVVEPGEYIPQGLLCWGSAAIEVVGVWVV